LRLGGARRKANLARKERPMQTALADFIKHTPDGQEADRILRSCVHCGFCTATCPTYQLLGDERDGPRGRIYLIKGLLEGQAAGRATQIHLDRCLTCRACETTCPSGVQYGHLVDIGRQQIEQRVRRPLAERLSRFALGKLIPYPHRFRTLLRMGQLLRPFLPEPLRRFIPKRSRAAPWPHQVHKRQMLLLEGCVQPALAPAINTAAARILDRWGITAIRAEGCCGAISYHLSAVKEALVFVRANIDRWWPFVEKGAEAIVSTASGCGTLIKDYGYLLRHDPHYAEKARRISALTRDISEVVDREDLSTLIPPAPRVRRIAFQAPCSLQHGQKLGGMTESLLQRLGFELTPVMDSHLCCGSAGVYSLLQRSLARPLLQNKIKNLQAGQPDLIATANIGCYSFLQQAASVPVKHWIELLDP
jgi:glycolate dehydrogenase iron-sulfur subunit